MEQAWQALQDAKKIYVMIGQSTDPEQPEPAINLAGAQPGGGVPASVGMFMGQPVNGAVEAIIKHLFVIGQTPEQVKQYLKAKGHIP